MQANMMQKASSRAASRPSRSLALRVDAVAEVERPVVANPGPRPKPGVPEGTPVVLPQNLPARPRRNRRSETFRSAMRESFLSPANFILPIFVHEESDKNQPIPSMPGYFRLAYGKNVIDNVAEARSYGINQVVIFPKTPEHLKTCTGEEAFNKNGLSQRTIRLLKDKFPDLEVYTDVALDPYNCDGHDGIVRDDGVILNDETVEYLCRQAVSQAEAGADCVSPSDMMDGRVGAIRRALDREGYTHVSIMSYTAKYASAFYGPFRDALASAPKPGQAHRIIPPNKKSYQMDPSDSVMFERLVKNGQEFAEQTKEHIEEYADAGLRTLVLAYREMDEEEYVEFNEKFTEAKNVVSADREEMIEEVAGNIERDLILLGATAVEDKLQNGVPECIDKLAQAGIKIWVLTGDKMETAINIGFACSLLRQGMRQVVINSETPENKALEKAGDKTAIAAAYKASVLQQIAEGKQLLTSSNENSEALALIVDGKSLTYAMEDDVKDSFLELAIGCASVICCRSSPKQKALVTRLVKTKTGSTTLAIGDGANDVGMLQEADIGVGISGVEGMQAVMSSDIAIAQFRYLERLLLVHGHWCYRRISSMICYFFYKNIAFGFTIFFYEIYASFSGQAVYNDWFLSLYNVFFTSLPVIALGVFDQDVSSRLCLKFPLLYQEGIQNVLFSWLRILAWAFNGVLSATIIFFFCIRAMKNQAFRKGGEVADLEVLGATMYTCVVWVVNCQMALSITYFTYIQHLFIWGGIILWYIFLMAYGAMDPNISTTAYKVFIEACAPAGSYWLLTLLVLITALLPYFAYSAIQIRFFPMYHQMIQWIRSDGQSDDPEYCNMVRQRSIRHTTVGYTARFEAKSKSSKER